MTGPSNKTATSKKANSSADLSVAVMYFPTFPVGTALATEFKTAASFGVMESPNPTKNKFTFDSFIDCKQSSNDIFECWSSPSVRAMILQEVSNRQRNELELKVTRRNDQYFHALYQSFSPFSRELNLPSNVIIES